MASLPAGRCPFIKVAVPAALVIAPMIAAAWFPETAAPLLVRQAALCIWGVGATLAFERWLFSKTLQTAIRSVGFVPARRYALAIAVLASVPMWLFLPLFAWLNSVPVELRTDWLSVTLGVVLVNGITEEVLHRAFVFGHLRRGRSFLRAAVLSASIFAAQHGYLVASIGWTAGLASIVLAGLVTFPLVYVFERGGSSIGAPAILHTSSNAPVMILSTPASFMTTALLPHMAVVLVCLYLVFAGRPFLMADDERAETLTSDTSGPILV
jgi:membrane protease YdiL (CAAX protease family)